MTPLAELIVQRLEEYLISDPTEETFVTVRLHGKGAVRRAVAAGKTPSMHSGYRLVPGDLVYSRIDARNGAFAIVPPELAGAVVSNDFPCFAVRSSRVHPTFLIRYLGSSMFYEQLRAASLGTTNRQRISEKALLRYEIPLPPLPQQERIVEILDEAAVLRRLRAEADERTSRLRAALFDDLFGSPLTNTKRWAIAALGELGSVVTGNTPPRTETRFYGDFIEWVKTDNIDAARGIVRPSAERLSEAGAMRGRTVPEGSVLITCIAGSLERIGDAAITDRRVAFNQQINAIVPKEDVEPAFLGSLVMALKPSIQRRATGVMTRIINKSELERIPAVLVPFPVQQRFAARVDEIREFEAKQALARERLNDLSQSLLHGAFKGEL